MDERRMGQSNEQQVFSEAEQAKRMEPLASLWRAIEANEPDTVIQLAYDCDHKLPNFDERTSVMVAIHSFMYG